MLIIYFHRILHSKGTRVILESGSRWGNWGLERLRNCPMFIYGNSVPNFLYLLSSGLFILGFKYCTSLFQLLKWAPILLKLPQPPFVTKITEKALYCIYNQPLVSSHSVLSPLQSGPNPTKLPPSLPVTSMLLSSLWALSYLAFLKHFILLLPLPFAFLCLPPFLTFSLCL